MGALRLIIEREQVVMAAKRKNKQTETSNRFVMREGEVTVGVMSLEEIKKLKAKRALALAKLHAK